MRALLPNRSRPAACGLSVVIMNTTLQMQGIYGLYWH